MAKKETRSIAVKKPKIGERYKFNFAGSPMIGVIDEKNDKLTEHYGHPWFWFKVLKEEEFGSTRDMRYPVSIYNIIGVIKAEQ